MKKINYSAIELYPNVQEKLKSWAKAYLFKNRISDLDWNFKCHHSTICLGPLPTEFKKDIGKEVELELVSIGIDDLVYAAKVKGNYIRRKGIPHITLAINIENGGKPVDSNNIKEWWPLDNKIKVKGIIKEIS